MANPLQVGEAIVHKRHFNMNHATVHKYKDSANE